MSDELVAVARAIDKYLADDCGMKLRKHALDGLTQAAIAALQPHIEAQREDAARRALEEAAVEAWATRNGVFGLCDCADCISQNVRTIDTAQFRRPADG